MLALDNRGMGLGASGVMDDPLIVKTLSLSRQPASGLLVVAVVKLSMLYATEFVMVLLRQDFLGLNRLYRLVV